MTELTLKRIALKDSYTIGRLYINDEYFCDTLEDPVRDLPATCPNTPQGINCKCQEKIYAETAIPAGTYKVEVTHSPRFKRLLPRLHNVPHFIGILIHRGNTAADSAGCILVGENKQIGKVINSTSYEERLVELLKYDKDIKIIIQ